MSRVRSTQQEGQQQGGEAHDFLPRLGSTVLREAPRHRVERVPIPLYQEICYSPQRLEQAGRRLAGWKRLRCDRLPYLSGNSIFL